MALQDRRRNLGPTDFEPLQVETESSAPTLEYKDESSPVFITQGVAKNASGSAFIEVGKTRLECCVFGPQPLRGQFKPRADISVSAKVEPFAAIPDHERLERLIEGFVRACLLRSVVLDSYPKSNINVLVNVISGPETFGTTIAAAANATTMAMVNAGIAMHDMVTATSVALVEGQVYADAEVSNNNNQLIAAYMTAQDVLVAFEIVSSVGVTNEELTKMLARGHEVGRELRKVMNGYLVEDYARA